MMFARRIEWIRTSDKENTIVINGLASNKKYIDIVNHTNHINNLTFDAVFLYIELAVPLLVNVM